MYEVKIDTLRMAYKPFDVVSDMKGSVGFIQEVSVNDSQSSPKAQISYSVIWLTGYQTKVAWWDHHELERHCNLMVEFAKGLCHPFGGNADNVEKLFDVGIEK